jgi:glycogen(starch) synthase
MKFAVCLTELAGCTSYTGGVGRRYAATIPELIRLGHEVTVVLIADSPIVEHPSFPPGAQMIVDESLTRVPWRLRTLPRALLFRRALVRAKVKHVYSPEWLGSCSFIPRGMKLVTNLVASLSLISEVAGAEAAARRSVLKSCLDQLQMWLEDRQIRGSQAVIACSEAILGWNAARYGSSLPSGSVVSNCINVERAELISTSAPLPSEWPAGGRRPVVLFAGRLQLIKGIDIALEAFEQVAEDYPDVSFVAAGGEGDLTIDPSIASIEANLPEQLIQRTTLLGQVDEATMYACMREADVVICPSRWEAFGNIALEVRAAGGVLIATTGSGFSESCTDDEDSLLVKPSDSRALAAAICRVLGDGVLRQRLASRGRARVQDFTASSTAKHLAERLGTIWGQ